MTTRAAAGGGVAALCVVVALTACSDSEDGTAGASDGLNADEYTLWTSVTLPRVASDPDTNAVELGVRFHPDRDGTINGIRFYKGSRNGGTHVAHFWTAGGTLLKTQTFSGETASGWQTIRFTSPVTVVAGRSYVASYHTDVGHYAGDNDYFTGHAVDNGPLHAPADAPAAHNGVYHYGSAAFPESSYKGSNYWVDVVFKPAQVVGGDAGATDSGANDTGATDATNDAATVVDGSSREPDGATDAAASDAARPSLCATSSVWQNLETCGWAGPANTGAPAGTTFVKTVTGGVVVTVDGTVIDAQDISGGVQVRAKNVVIRNCHIRNSAGGAGGSGVVNINPGASATIESSTLDGQNATHTCIWHEGSSMTARHNDCKGVNDGIFSWATVEGVDGTGDNFTIEDNYLHAFTTQAANGHIDGYQTEGAKHGIIRHNTFDVTQSQDSDVAIWNSRKSADDILVDHNLMAGGGFAVYAEDYSPSEQSPAGGYTVTNIRFTNNVFSTVHYGCVGGYGVWFPRGNPTDAWNRSGNVVLETGQNVDTKNPTYNGVLCN